MAHLGRPKGEPDPAYSLAPVADAARRAARHRGRTSPTDTVGESARRRSSRRWPTATSRCWRTSGSTPGETSKDDAERGAFADQLAALGDAFVSDGFGVVHRKQASVYDVAQRLPHAMGGLVARRDRGAAQADRGPGAAVRRGARRLEGERQARRDRQPARQGRQAADRRRDGVHLPRGRRATRSARACSRRTRSRPAGSTSSAPTDTGVEIVLPTDIVVAPEFKADAPPPRSWRPTRSRPTRSGWTSARSPARRSPTAIDGRPDGLLERPDGRLRVRGLRRGHPGGRPGADRGRRAVRRRRRRLRGRRTPARLRRDRLRPHLHRRWRQPGVPRGQGPARHRRTRRTDGSTGPSTTAARR